MTSPGTDKNTDEPATGAQANPYLQRLANEEGNSSLDTDDEEAAAAAELAAEKKKRKQRRKRRVALAFIATLLLASVVIAVAVYRQRSTRVEYGRATNPPRVLPPPPSAGATTGRDNRTEQALQEMQHLTGENRNTNAQATTGDAANGVNTGLTSPPNDSSHPFNLPNSSETSQNSSTPGKP